MKCPHNTSIDCPNVNTSDITKPNCPDCKHFRTENKPTHAIASFDENGMFNEYEDAGSLEECKQSMKEQGNPSNWSIIPTMESGGYWITNTKGQRKRHNNTMSHD